MKPGGRGPLRMPPANSTAIAPLLVGCHVARWPAEKPAIGQKIAISAESSARGANSGWRWEAHKGCAPKTRILRRAVAWPRDARGVRRREAGRRGRERRRPAPSLLRSAWAQPARLRLWKQLRKCAFAFGTSESLSSGTCHQGGPGGRRCLRLLLR